MATQVIVVNGVTLEPDADLRNLNLSGMDLRGISLSNADLRGANLSGSNLRWVVAIGTDFRGANLS